MKNLYEPAVLEEITSRLAGLRPDSPRRWGSMSPAQAVAHCALSMEWALGEKVPETAPFPIRVLGRIVRPMALGNDKPLRRNSPTAKELIVPGQPDLDAERNRLRALIERFAAVGPQGCTNHPHTFFGRLTPDEWAILMYKHLDHHLRQFSV
jgi:hypothetical protein